MRIWAITAVVAVVLIGCGSEDDGLGTTPQQDAAIMAQTDGGTPGADTQLAPVQMDAQPGIGSDAATAPRHDAGGADTRPQPQTDARPADTLPAMMSLIPPSQVSPNLPGSPACVIIGTQCPRGGSYECCGALSQPATGSCGQFGPKPEDYGCCSKSTTYTCTKNIECCPPLTCKGGRCG